MDEALLDRELIGALHERGQRVTPQRLVLHRVLRASAQHLTAEDVLKRSRDVLPNVSLPTIYATLELFEELGVIRRVPAAGPARVYDSRLDHHHHVRCRVCGRVADVEADLDRAAVAEAARAQGFEPERVDVAVVGVCRACATAAP